MGPGLEVCGADRSYLLPHPDAPQPANRSSHSRPKFLRRRPRPLPPPLSPHPSPSQVDANGLMWFSRTADEGGASEIGTPIGTSGLRRVNALEAAEVIRQGGASLADFLLVSGVVAFAPDELSAMIEQGELCVVEGADVETLWPQVDASALRPKPKPSRPLALAPSPPRPRLPSFCPQSALALGLTCLQTISASGLQLGRCALCRGGGTHRGHHLAQRRHRHLVGCIAARRCVRHSECRPLPATAVRTLATATAPQLPRHSWLLGASA